MRTLCVVSTLYNSKPTVVEFLERLDGAVSKLDFVSIQLVLVDDGSDDLCADEIRSYAPRSFDILLLTLSRNFGHHKAILAGLGEADADVVVLLDSDLEEPPELIPNLLTKFDDLALDALHGVQSERRRRGPMDSVYSSAYSVLGLSARTEIPRNISTLKAMNRRYVDAVLEYGEQDPSFSSLLSLVGFRQATFKFSKLDRSRSVYTLRKRFKNFSNALFGHLNIAFRLTLAMLTTLSLSFLATLVYLVNVAFSGTPPPGYLSLAVIMLFGFMIVALVLLVFAVYLERIHLEVLGRPRVHVREREVFRRQRGGEWRE